MVQAPGEAEATCAALNRGGYVDACATNDSDVLLFGAETAFHTLKPLVSLLPRYLWLTPADWHPLRILANWPLICWQAIGRVLQAMHICTAANFQVSISSYSAQLLHFLLCRNMVLGQVQTATPNLCAVTKLDMGRVRARLGVNSGGHRALVAMALLMGGDYFVRGAERIGPKQVRRPAAPQVQETSLRRSVMPAGSRGGAVLAKHQLRLAPGAV